MPSGKSHAIATVVAGGVTAPLLFVAGQPAANALALAGGCLLGLIFNPDLDVRRRDTHSDTIMRHSFGRFIWRVWDLLWKPYAYMIPNHRHPLSHMPLLGTALRIVYALSLPALAWFLLGRIVALPPLWPLPAVVWWGLGGLALVDGLHALMDWFF